MIKLDGFRSDCVATFLAIGLLSGCTTIQLAVVLFGQPFEIVNGIDHIGSTKARVVEITGDNYEIEIQTLDNNAELEILKYEYGGGLSNTDAHSSASVKSQVLVFSEGKLIAQTAQSSFAHDTTYYESERASEIKNGMTTGNVTDILGNPSGFLLFNSGDLKYRYDYMTVKSSGRSNIMTDSFEVTFTKSDDEYFVSNTKKVVKELAND